MPDKVAAALSAAKIHEGPIHSNVAGRTDHLPMHVENGSYVIPADIISAMGEGNSMAGFKVAQQIFGPSALKKPAGGKAEGIPIVAAGGEYILTPEQVVALGKGSLESGQKVLDAFIKTFRKKTIKILSQLPGPK
jgi:hypothetical protein